MIAAFAEDWSSVPNTHMEADGHLLLQGANTLFWPPWALGMYVAHIHTCRPNTHIKQANGFLMEEPQKLAIFHPLPCHQLGWEYGGHFTHSGNRMGLIVWRDFLAQS